VTRASLFVASLVLCVPAFAQQGQPVPPGGAAATVARPAAAVTEGSCAEEYRVGGGDVLEVAVFGNDDLTRTVAVRPDGAIAFPLVGDVPAAGATVPELRGRLVTALARFLLNPQVELQVREYNSHFVTLFGEVAQPGRRPLRGCTRVIDALLQAGGFKDAASGEIVVSFEEEREPLRARVERGVFTPAARKVLETVLHGGEIVTVLPRAYVTVQGEVARPNRYAIEGRLTVTGAVTVAGGLTRSAASKAKVVRVSPAGERQVLEADLKAIREGRADDFALQPEDIVTVPRRFF
jgi:polysaccharide biosynthesis/export protein